MRDSRPITGVPFASYIADSRFKTLRLRRTVYHRASHHGPMAYILIAGEKIFTDRESRSNFPKSYSKILPNLSSRENGVYTTANEKLRFVCLLNVNINITHSTFSIINSNFTITRLMFIYVCLYTIVRTTRVERQY